MHMKTAFLWLLFVFAPLGWLWGQNDDPFTNPAQSLTTYIEVQLQQQDSVLRVRYRMHRPRPYHRYHLRLALRSADRDFFPLDWQGDSLDHIADTLWREVWAAVPGTELAGYQGPLQAIMTVDSVTYAANERGIGYGMLSMLVPGLGSYLTSDARTPERFVATSLGFVTCLGLGLTARQQYPSFSTLLLIGAGTIYLADVVIAFQRGARNEQRRIERLQGLRPSAPVAHLRLGPTPTGLALQLRF